MKIAVPLFGKRVSPRFDYAPSVAVIEADPVAASVVQRHETDWTGYSVHERVRFLQQAHIKVVICGGIASDAQDALQQQRIKVIAWVTGRAEDALRLYLKGQLLPGTMLCRGGAAGRWNFCNRPKRGNKPGV